MEAKLDISERELAGRMLATLFHEYQRPIFGYLLRLAGDREWADELCLKSFNAAFRQRNPLPGVTHQRAWLFQIATDTAFRAIKRRQRLAWAPWQRPAGRRRHGSPASSKLGGQEAVEQALFGVPLDERAVLLLYSHHGLSMPEVAEALKISEGAARARLYRARLLFRKAYEREVGDEKPR